MAGCRPHPTATHTKYGRIYVICCQDDMSTCTPSTYPDNYINTAVFCAYGYCSYECCSYVSHRATFLSWHCWHCCDSRCGHKGQILAGLLNSKAPSNMMRRDPEQEGAEDRTGSTADRASGLKLPGLQNRRFVPAGECGAWLSRAWQSAP